MREAQVEALLGRLSGRLARVRQGVAERAELPSNPALPVLIPAGAPVPQRIAPVDPGAALQPVPAMQPRTRQPSPLSLTLRPVPAPIKPRDPTAALREAQRLARLMAEQTG